jgi:hypothetical protein
MFEADVSKATVLALFLLPDNLTKLRTKFFNMRPGTRIVMNTFAIPEWTPDEEQKVENDCVSWCTSLLYIVPAHVEGTWRLPQGALTLRQNYQVISGELVAGGKTLAVSNGKLRGDLITFTVDGVEYTGRVTGDAMAGTSKSGAWKASKGS